MLLLICCFFFFFFNDTATTEIYTLSLHDALPIYIWEWELFRAQAGVPVPHCFGGILRSQARAPALHDFGKNPQPRAPAVHDPDRKSTRLNSSHLVISYAVFCLKKKKVLAPTHTLP